MYRIRLRIPPESVTHWTTQYHPEYYSKRYEQWCAFDDLIGYVYFYSEAEARRFIADRIKLQLAQIDKELTLLNERKLKLNEDKEAVHLVEVF